MTNTKRNRGVDKMDRYWEIKIHVANPKNLNILNDFLLYLKSKNRTENTIRYYRGKVQNFFRETAIPISSFTSTNIQDEISRLQKGRKEYTIKSYLEVLSSLFKFCVVKGHIESSPFQKSETNYWQLKKPLPNSENEKVINEYLNYMKDANKNEAMVINTRQDLQILFNKKNDSFRLQTSEDTEKWIKEKQNHLTKQSISCYLSCLRAFYQFCVDKEYIGENPIYYQRGEVVRYWEVRIPLANQENKDRINEYLASIHAANYSKYTVRSYRCFLESFFKEREEEYSCIPSNEIQEWLIQVQKKCAESTISRHISILSAFYSYCVEEEYIEKSPMKKRWFPRLPKPVPKYLTKEEVAKVRKQNEKEHFRNRVLAEFMLTSGCRVGEINLLDRSEVDLERRTAMVIGKGRKIRQVNFSISCGLLLERYLDSRHDQDPALFVTNQWNARRLSSKQMGEIIRKIGTGAELSSSLHPHRLRHTFATDLLEKGAELSFIADELGHGDLQTTQVYAHLPKQKIKVLYRKYMG